jgi:sugar phosphate isomerase/epimerase
MTAQPEPRSWRPCFSTLGCADLPFPEILALAREFRISGLELRGMGGRMDMPEYCAENNFTPDAIARLRQAHGTELVVTGSSVKLVSAMEKDRLELLNLGNWAESLGIPWVRVFGGGTWGEPLSDADYAHAAETVEWWRGERTARNWNVDLMLETHDAFSASEPCLKLESRLPQPLNLIWDTHHTWRVGGESPEFTWKQLSRSIRHVQIKDSVDRPSARHPYTYVLPGDGQMPLADLMALLDVERFSGFVSLEWERHWHPYLPPLREALARMAERNWFATPRTSSLRVAAATVAAGALVLPKSSQSTEAYAWWRSAAESLLQPLAALMQKGKADLPIRGQASNHGPQADRLESFARPCLLAAHWLASEKGPNEKLSRSDIADWFRRGLLIGTDPNSPEYWGPTANHHQHTVEMAALTLAFQIARPQLWEPFSKTEREQILRWFASIRGAGLHRNNHMFFNVMTLSFLAQEGRGRRADAPVMRHLMDVIEDMSLGGGWFIDGMNETVDYYQAYAFHYYGPWWAKLYGYTDPKRARRWKDWLGQFLKDYVHFFAASGENPPFGRSMCYRFAATAPFALAEHCGVSAVPAGQARRVCTRNLEYFLSRPVLQKQGALSLGWTDEFPALTEAYSCAGSTYWAAKAFAPLLLPGKHRFWTSLEKPLPCEAKDFQRAIPQAGLVVRSHAGEIEVLNNASGICVSNIKFGTWKWAKLSFRSGVGGEIAPSESGYPPDASLTAEFADGSIFGRHQCQPEAVSPDHCGSVYGLGDRFSQNHVSVETRLWWKAGWQFHWHHIVAYRKARLRLGTYSLPLFDAGAETVEVRDQFGLARDAQNGVAIQPILGFNQVRRQDSAPDTRVHILAWHSLVLLAETGWLTGEHDLIALSWVGRRTEESAPWTVASSYKGRILLRHPTLGDWQIEHPELPTEKSLVKTRTR